MSPGSGVLSGTPERSDLGTYYVNVTVNDGKGGWDHSNFTLAVLNVNDPPIINESLADFSFNEDTVDESISLIDWFMDYDNNELSFSHFRSDKLTVTIMSSGIVRLVPEPNWSGYEVLTFRADDGEFQVSDSVNVTVVPVNDPPIDAEIEILVEELWEGENQSVKGSATDVDIPYGDSLSYSWSSNVSGPIGSGESLNMSIKAGAHNITLNVSDSAGAWVLVTKDIIILPVKDDDIDKNDTDGDNLPDVWEEDNFGNLSQDGDDDPDNDTFTNHQEWENNTNPNDPDDYPGKTQDQPESDDSDTDSFFTNYWWLFLLLFLVIILLIIFALIASRKKKEEEEESEEEEAEEETESECPECGAMVPIGEGQCSECGAEIGLEEDGEAEEEELEEGEDEDLEEGDSLQESGEDDVPSEEPGEEPDEVVGEERGEVETELEGGPEPITDSDAVSEEEPVDAQEPISEEIALVEEPVEEQVEDNTSKTAEDEVNKDDGIENA
jgi:hypothetical protein